MFNPTIQTDINQEHIAIKFYTPFAFSNEKPACILRRDNTNFHWEIENVDNSPISIFFDEDKSEYCIKTNTTILDSFTTHCYSLLLDKINTIIQDFTLTYTTPALFDVKTIM